MRIFLFEFITGGGLAGQPLPPGLADEGERMLRAAVGDLLEIDGVEVWIGRDPRLPPLPAPVRVVPADGETTPMAAYLRGVAIADAVWPIAPETGGELERLSRAVVDAGSILLGSRPEAVAVTASKRATARLLAAAGAAVAPAYGEAADLPPLPGPWVVKPDDGAGCVDTLRVADRAAAAALLAARPDAGLIAQPWIAGDALSLSLLCADGNAIVLSCNRQHIVIEGGTLGLAGLTVAALPADDGHRRLAHAVARALPGLWGYVGIDFVQTADGPVVIEINPRLTTAYCGLREALGSNVARRVLDLREQELGRATTPPPRAAMPVRLQLEASHEPL